MKIIVVMPSKAKSDPLILEGEHYLSRLRSPLSAQSLLTQPKSNVSEQEADKRIDLEGQELLQKTEKYFRIALTDRGKPFASAQFASYLEQLGNRTPKVAFIIGGAFGLSQQVIETSDATLSLSAMTLPHRMAFLVLSEQLYRSGEILRGTPYHK